MKLTILGASGRIGRHVLEQALARNHDVTVLVRDPSRVGIAHGRVAIVTGDVHTGEAVDRALAGADAVISAIGPDANTPDQMQKLRTGMRRTVEAMHRHGVRRIINLSGAGITAPGEEKPMVDRIATRIVQAFSGHVVAAKQAEYDALANTDLEWVAVRPALVTDGPLTGRYAAGPGELRPGARISRADVAHLMLAQAEDPTHAGHPGIFVRQM